MASKPLDEGNSRLAEFKATSGMCQSMLTSNFMLASGSTTQKFNAGASALELLNSEPSEKDLNQSKNSYLQLKQTEVTNGLL